MDLTRDDRQSLAEGVPPYPQMLKWLRD